MIMYFVLHFDEQQLQIVENNRVNWACTLIVHMADNIIELSWYVYWFVFFTVICTVNQKTGP